MKEEEPVVPGNQLFGQTVPLTKAAPAGYTPYVPEGCGLLMNNKEDENSKSGGLTWFDSNDDEDNGGLSRGGNNAFPNVVSYVL